MISVLSAPPIIDDPPPSTLISTLCALGIAKQNFLGRRALPPQAAALADGKLLAEFRFGEPGQREVEIVAAEQQMLADGGAGEVDLVAIARDANQREVAGAAADVADQHHLAIEQQLAGAREIVGDPGIEGRGGFFDQSQARRGRRRSRPVR